MTYILQFIVTNWWLFGLILVSSILELYVVPNVIAWYNGLRYPKYRHFSVVAACIFAVALFKFILYIPASDPAQAQKLENTANSVGTPLACGCINVCTCASVTLPLGTETVTQSYVDSLILASKDRELTIDELEGLTREELALLRNAIFAMAGRRYGKGSKYSDIFQSYDWYNPYISPDDFTYDYFNHYQFKNMNKITDYEKSMGYRK